MLGLLASSAAGIGFMGKLEKDSCSERRIVRLNMRCNMLGALPAADPCTQLPNQAYLKLSAQS